MRLEEHTITLDSLRFYAYHGAEPQEAIVGAWYTVDITIKTDATDAILNDNLNGTINYAKVAEITKQQMQIRSALLEHVAGRIVNALLDTFHAISMLNVKVSKENPPVGIPCSKASAEITAVR